MRARVKGLGLGVGVVGGPNPSRASSETGHLLESVPSWRQRQPRAPQARGCTLTPPQPSQACDATRGRRAGERRGIGQQVGMGAHGASGAGTHRLQQRVHSSSQWVKQPVNRALVWVSSWRRSDHVQRRVSVPEGRQVRDGRSGPQAQAERQRWQRHQRQGEPRRRWSRHPPPRERSGVQAAEAVAGTAGARPADVAIGDQVIRENPARRRS